MLVSIWAVFLIALYFFAPKKPCGERGDKPHDFFGCTDQTNIRKEGTKMSKKQCNYEKGYLLISIIS